MLTITPGYTFGATEIPNRAKLGLMVSGMSINAIDISQIDPGLIGISTAPSYVSLAAEGHMRHDYLNSLWVQTKDGEVKLFRANWGGWETLRPRLNAGNAPYAGTSKPMAASYNWKIETNGDTNASNVKANSNQNPASVDGFRHPGLDSGVSGGFARTLGRGGCFQHCTANGVNVAFGYPALVDNTANATNVNLRLQLDAGAQLGRIYSGQVMKAFVQSDARTNCMSWFYGASLANQ